MELRQGPGGLPGPDPHPRARAEEPGRGGDERLTPPATETPVIITAALVGAEVTREQTPYLPVSPVEIGEAAAAAAAAGAAMVHVHVRDAAGLPTQDGAIFAQAIAEIRARCDVIVQVSTGGATGMTPEERLQPVLAVPDDRRPDMASLTAGSCNFGRDVFLNPQDEVERFAFAMRERGIKPEVEVFESGMLTTALRLAERGLLDEPVHVDFVLGVSGAMPATVAGLVHLVQQVPPGWTWSVCGIGRHQLRMGTVGLAMGGHVRTGLEDNIYFRRGELATSNAQLVERIARLARELERPVATPSQARELLGLPVSGVL